MYKAYEESIEREVKVNESKGRKVKGYQVVSVTG